VMVGGLGSGAGLILNPREVTADGEWEAWLLSFKTFATRYRSFAELMQAAAAEDLGNVGVSQIGAADVARQPCLAKITTVVTRR